MVADHATLRRAIIHEVTAGAFAVVSVELQIKVFMPPIVAGPEISFLRRCAYMKRHEERAAKQHDELAAPHSITSLARASRLSATVSPNAFAVLRLITSSYLVGACTGRSAAFSPLRMR